AIRSGSDDVRAASAAIDQVVEATVGAAGAMASRATSVSGSVDSVAAISEANGAAAEQVSATTEEMAAHARDVAGDAAALASMSQQLSVLVARYRLDPASGPDRDVDEPAPDRPV